MTIQPPARHTRPRVRLGQLALGDLTFFIQGALNVSDAPEAARLRAFSDRDLTLWTPFL